MGEPSANRKIGKGMAVGSLGIVFSRISGLARDVVFSRAFGTGATMSAFILAFTIPNLFRRFFGEGALTEAFVPTFNHRLETDGKESSLKYLSAILCVLAVALVAICGIAIGVTVLLRPLFTRQQDVLTLNLLPIMLPYMVFICLAGFLAGTLNSFGKFAAPAFSPIILNVTLIAAAVGGKTICASRGLDPGYALAVAVTIAGVLQLVALYPSLRRVGVRFRAIWPDRSELSELGRLILPGALTAGVYQINVLADRFLANWISEEAVASLYYSERLVFLPVGVFAVALTAACLPVLSKAFARGDEEEMVDSVFYGLRHVLFLSLPCLAGLLILGRETLALLFRGGAFDERSLNVTHEVMVLYALGIPAFGVVKILRSAFFAQKKMSTPMKVSIFCMALNVTLNVILMQVMQQRGLALATALSSYVNVTLLTVFLLKSITVKAGQIREFLMGLIKIAIAVAAACGAMYGLRTILPTDLGRVFSLLIPGGAGVSAFVIVAALVKCKELTELIAIVRRRK